MRTLGAHRSSRISKNRSEHTALFSLCVVQTLMRALGAHRSSRMPTTDPSTQDRSRFKMSPDLRRALGASGGHWELPAGTAVLASRCPRTSSDRSKHTRSLSLEEVIINKIVRTALFCSVLGIFNKITRQSDHAYVNTIEVPGLEI